MLFQPKKPAVITSFERILLHTSGMRFSTDQEIVMKDGKAEVTEYSIRYHQGGDERIPTRRVLVETEDILKLLNDCTILSWDGFVGNHPRGVRDGIQFRLEGIVNDGKKIYAHGSQNFPKHYRDFTDGLYEILSKGEEL